MEEVERTLPIKGGHIGLVESAPPNATQGVVVVIPPFAMQARDLFPIALTLARNGFSTIRVDGRDSLGSGSGAAFDYKLSTVKDDIERVIDYVDLTKGGRTPIIVVGMSLAARPLIRLLTTRNLDGAVLFTPVVCVRSTLYHAVDQDLFALPDSEVPDTRVLGQITSGDFVVDARRHGMGELEPTLQELREIASPVSILCGDQDPWVSIDDLQRGVEMMKRKPRFAVIPAATHELNRNPRVAMSYLRQLAAECLALVRAKSTDASAPRFAEVITELGQKTRSVGEPIEMESRR